MVSTLKKIIFSNRQKMKLFSWKVEFCLALPLFCHFLTIFTFWHFQDCLIVPPLPADVIWEQPLTSTINQLLSCYNVKAWKWENHCDTDWHKGGLIMIHFKRLLSEGCGTHLTNTNNNERSRLVDLVRSCRYSDISNWQISKNFATWLRPVSKSSGFHPILHVYLSRFSIDF